MPLGLNDIEARIIGCLIEKENATPDYYPLTLNALTNACNQKSNRNPVMSLDEHEVEQALELLLKKDIVYLFFGSGSRTRKYKHLLPKLLDLEHPETAVICLLLLRGPQTLGELNQRSGRIHQFSGLDEVSQTVHSLAGRNEPLVLALPKAPGQKEERFVQLLTGEIDIESLSREASKPVGGGNSNRAVDLEQRIAELEAAFDDYRKDFEEFKRQFE